MGVAKPLAALHGRGDIDLRVTFEYLVRPSDVDWADVVVFSRNVNPLHGGHLAHARAAGKPVIYELDDNLLDVPEAAEEFAPYRRPEVREQLERYLAEADLVRVYSARFEEVVRSRCPNVFLASGPIAWSLVPEAGERRSGPLSVVYASGRSSDYEEQQIAEPVRRIVASIDDVEFVVWGPVLESLKGVPRVRQLRPVRDYDRFFARFARERFDIGLAPLPSGRFYECKSNNKFREYAATGVAGIYADSEVYRGDVDDGVTGLLVDRSTNDWERALTRLIRDWDLRAAISGRALALARERYSEEITQAEWLENILEMLASRRAAPDAARTRAVSRGSSPRRSRGGPAKQLMYYAAGIIRSLRSGSRETASRFVVQYHSWRTLLRLRKEMRQPRP